MVGFFSARSRSSLTSERTGSLSSSFVSLIFLSCNRTIDRQLKCKATARPARLSVAQVSQLNESARCASWIGEFHHRKSCEVQKYLGWSLVGDVIDNFVQFTSWLLVTNSVSGIFLE